MKFGPVKLLPIKKAWNNPKCKIWLNSKQQTQVML